MMVFAMAATLSAWADHQLSLAEVINGDGCTVQFFKSYDGTTFSDEIPAGALIDLAAGETVYTKLTMPNGKLPARSQALTVLNKATNESVAVQMIGDELATFQWPAADVEVTVEFINAGYWGDPEVNDGKNVMWQKFMIDNTYYKLVFTGSGKMADVTTNTNSLVRVWGPNKNVKEIVFGEGIESTGDITFNYANSLEKVDWGTLKHIGQNAFYRPYKLGLNDTVVFPATIESIGSGAFAYGDQNGAINGVYDFSACTNLTEVAQGAFYNTSVTCILPSSIKASYKNSFKLPPCVVLPEGMTLFVNDTQMPDDDEKATVNLSLAQPFTFELKPGYYRLNLGEVTGEGNSLQFYTTMNASYQLSNEVKAGMKVYSENEETKVYIKFTPATNAYLEKDGIRVKNDATGAFVPLKQENTTIYSFVMPKSSVTISAEFVECVLAGIQGNITWSVREDGIWSDEGYSATPGTKKYKLIFSGTGAYGGLSSSGSTPWGTYASQIGSVVYEEGITDAGDGSLRDLYNLYSVQFPSTMTTLGSGMFRSNSNLKYLKMPVLLSDNSDQSVFSFTRDDLTVDFSECTELTTIGSEKYNGFKGTAILPATITSIQKLAFASPNNPIKIYFVAPEDRTLFLNNVQSMVEPNEKGWIELTGYHQQNAYTVEWKEGYHNRLSLGELTGESGTSLALYSTYDGTNLSNQITAGNKLHDSMTGETVYVKASYANYRRMDDDGLVVINKATGERIPVKVESLANNIYSFTFPGADVTVGVNTIIGGYCGDASFNNGYDARWQLDEFGVDEDGNTTYKLTIKGTGAMANASYGRTGWRSTSLLITELEIEEGITRIGSLSFYQTPIKKAKLANSILSIGQNAFYGWTQYEGALVMPSSLTQLDYRAFERSTFDLDFTPCTQFLELKDGLQVWCGARVVMPASLERITANRAFTGSWQEGCCTYVDLSRCTKLTNITGNWFDDCKGEIILPGSMQGLNIPAVSYGGFEDCTSKLSITPFDDKILFIDGQRMEEVDGKVDISTYMGQTVEFDWRPGFSVKTGAVTGGEGTFRYYTDFDGSNPSNEIPNGYKVLRDEADDVPLYVQTVSSSCTVFPEDLNITATIDGVSQPVEAELIKDDLFRFTLPAGAVKISGKFTHGGYCGIASVNNGRDTRWEIVGNERLVISGVGEVGSRPWSEFVGLNRNIKAIDVDEGVTSLPEYAFHNTGIDGREPFGDYVLVSLPSTLTKLSPYGFYYTYVSVDMSKCTKMTMIEEQVLTGLMGEILLPATVNRISSNAFWGLTIHPNHLYVPVGRGEALFVNDQQQKDTDGRADIVAMLPSYQLQHTSEEDLLLNKYKGYYVDIATSADGNMKLYYDAAATVQVNEGMKVVSQESTSRIYVKVNAKDTKILFVDGLTLKTNGGVGVAIKQEADDVFSFELPDDDMSISATYATGGYCGENGVNSGHNLIWTLNDCTLDFQKNALAQGGNRQMGNFPNGAPWQQMGATVKTISLGDATSIGDNAFSTCTAVIAIELGATPMTVGQNAFAKSTCLIVPAASYADYQTGWSEYASQLEKDKETLTMKDGQQWRTCYSRVARRLPAGLKAYVVSDIEGSQVITGKALDYIPAAQAVLIEHSDKTAITAEATTSGAPYSADNQTPVCRLTTSEANMLQWIDSPMPVSATQGYTLYKDEFVMVSSGTLPAGIAFLPAQKSTNRAPALSIFVSEDNATAIELPAIEAAKSGTWYTIDGKKLAGKPTQKGLYICNGLKVVIK